MSEQLLEQRLREIDDLQSRDGWHRDGEMIPSLYALIADGLEPVRYPVSEELWKLPLRPGQQLKLLAKFLVNGVPESSRTNVIRGLVFATEAWMATASSKNEDEVRQLLEYAETRRISQHPDRVEMRLTVGVLRGGYPLAVVHPRGGAIEVLGEGAEGEVVSGLDELIAAMTHAEDRSSP